MTITQPSLAWYLHRLRAMDAAEIFCRVRERLRHTTERFALPAVAEVRLEDASRAVPALPAGSGAPAVLKKALAEDAARLLAGRWTLFGWKEAQVSSPPQWHRDYASGVEVPLSERRMDHRALPAGADGRVIWEINRWAEMVRLAMHAHVNGDLPAIEAAQGWLEDWVGKNPPGRGVNWTSALEGGLRLVNFCWFDALVKAAGTPDASGTGAGGREAGILRRIQERQAVLANAIVPRHVWWVKRYLSFGSSANNHRLGELTGLLLAVRRWPELEKVAGTADGLWPQIAECVLSQFAGDGGNREQALHYHLFAFELALHACRAMGTREGAVVERLCRAAEFFARMAHPVEPWDFGDSDDAQIVPLTARRGTAIAEWHAWMSGPKDAADSALGYYLGHAPTRHPPPAIRNCDWWLAPQSGMAVCGHDGWKVRLDASPLGYGRLAAHGHCDALHVSVWDGDHALVIDPGTGGYSGDRELRAELASWAAHNGPQPIEGFRTPRRMGTFLWLQHHAQPVLQRMGDGVKGSLRHQGHELARTVRVEDGAVEIEDREGEERPFRVRWLLAPGCRARALDGSSANWQLVRGTRSWHFEISAGSACISLGTGRASPAYGASLTCHIIDVAGRGPMRATLRRLPPDGGSYLVSS